MKLFRPGRGVRETEDFGVLWPRLLIGSFFGKKIIAVKLTRRNYGGSGMKNERCGVHRMEKRLIRLEEKSAERCDRRTRKFQRLTDRPRILVRKVEISGLFQDP